MSAEYPLCIFLQVVGEYGEPKEDECWQAAHESAALMQIGDTLETPIVVDDSPLGRRRLEGWFIIGDRELKMHHDGYMVGASLTLFIRMR